MLDNNISIIYTCGTMTMTMSSSHMSTHMPHTKKQPLVNESD